MNHRDAYRIACLGVTEEDWRLLALEALEVSRTDSSSSYIHYFFLFSTLLLKGTGSGSGKEVIFEAERFEIFGAHSQH